MLDSYIRNCLSNLNRRVTELEEAKKRPTKPSDDSGGPNIPPDGTDPEKAVVTWADLDTAFLHANFRSLQLSKQLNEDYYEGGNEPYYVDNDDDPKISLEVIHGEARMGKLTITDNLFKEVVVKNEEEDEIEYYDYLTRNEAYTKEEVDATYARTENLPDFTRITKLEENVNRIASLSKNYSNLMYISSRMYFAPNIINNRDYMYFKSPYIKNYFVLTDVSTETETSALKLIFRKESYIDPSSQATLMKIKASGIEIPILFQESGNPYITKMETYTKEEIESNYGSKITTLEEKLNGICDTYINSIYLRKSLFFTKLINERNYIYFESPHESNAFCLRDISDENNPSILELLLIKGVYENPESTTSVIKINGTQVEIPQLIQATDNPYLTKNDISEFSYNSDDNKLHATATIKFDAVNLADNEHVYMEFYSTYGMNAQTYALKNVPAGGNYAKLNMVSVREPETTLIQIECDKVVIPELYKDEDTPYATETFVNEQINNFGSNFYVVEVVIPANNHKTELPNTIPDYATKIQTHKLIMPNTDGKHIFTLRKSNAGTYGANWVNVAVTAEKITFTSVYVSTEDITIHAQFEWVKKPTG